jgi:xanthine dehydrogenase accessory factor
VVSADISTLRVASAWLHAGHGVLLFTVVKTWGSAPRPVGALAAIRDDGLIEGSVSGGCIEDDLVDRVRQGLRVEKPRQMTYGLTGDEAHRFGLPCGGTLQLVCERISEAVWVDALLARCESHQLVMRELSMCDGSVNLAPARRGDELAFDGHTLRAPHGPRWRLLLIGAGQLSQYVARIAATLDFEIFICDPREEYPNQREALPCVHYVEGKPDDAVTALAPDARSRNPGQGARPRAPACRRMAAHTAPPARG